MLTELDGIPEGLLALPANELHRELRGPTLMHLPGRHESTLFVSVLMHGNETTGWDAVRKLLQQYEPGGGEQLLPRSLSLFIANTAAAEQGVRRLPGQPDYNRIWSGTDLPHCEESDMMQQVVDIVCERNLFASVDVHNNTGINPYHSCINAFDSRTLQLATMFNRTVVYFVRPRGVQSIAMTQHCPAVTLECGKAGQESSTERAMEFIDACLHLSEFAEHSVSAHDVDVFHTTAVVKIPEYIKFGFEGVGLDLRLHDELEHFNFSELPAGTVFGEVSGDLAQPLVALNESDYNVSDYYFVVEEGLLKTRRPLMPSMLTLDPTIIRQDCLCYLMERYEMPA